MDGPKLVSRARQTNSLVYQTCVAELMSANVIEFTCGKIKKGARIIIIASLVQDVVSSLSCTFSRS